MRILIADDEPLVRYGLISILEDIQGERQTVVEAENGLELIEKAREIRPHIAFVDIRMPKKDGLEAVSEAREYSPETLWVMITGHADFSSAQKAVKLGVEDFLLKPADPGELKILMKKLSAKMRERRASRQPGAGSEGGRRTGGHHLHPIRCVFRGEKDLAGLHGYLGQPFTA